MQSPPSRMPDRLLRGHSRFQDKHFGDEREFLLRLASEGQSPDAFFVGCSDSRVVPELLTSSAPGTLFVLRNVANLSPRPEHPDASAGAALEYAVGYLEVRHVIVCGHYDCGGIKAGLDGLDAVRGYPTLAEWLLGVIPACERARAALPGGGPDALWRRAVEENVLEQLFAIVQFPVVADALNAERLELHGWVYDLYSLDLHVYVPERGRFERAREVAPA